MTTPGGGFLEGLAGGFDKGSSFKRGMQQDKRKRDLDDETRVRQRAQDLRDDVAAGLTNQLTTEQLAELVRKRAEIATRNRRWDALRIDPTISGDPKYRAILGLPADEGLKAFQDIASHPERYDKPDGAGGEGTVWSAGPGEPAYRIKGTIATPITTAGGASLAKADPPSDAQLRGKGFAETLTRINPIISDYEKAGVAPSALSEGLDALGSIPVLGNVAKPVTGWMANANRSDEQRQYKNYARQWMVAVLRPESGGAISDQEFDNYYKTYFKEANDDPQTVINKQRARLDKEREANTRGGLPSAPPSSIARPAGADAGASKPKYADNPY